MGCIFTILLFVSTRGAIVFWWLVDPDRWRSAFENGWVPIVGLILFPATTLVFVIVAPTGRVSDYDMIWIGLALLGDLASHFHHFKEWRYKRALST